MCLSRFSFHSSQRQYCAALVSKYYYFIRVVLFCVKARPHCTTQLNSTVEFCSVGHSLRVWPRATTSSIFYDVPIRWVVDVEKLKMSDWIVGSLRGVWSRYFIISGRCMDTRDNHWAMTWSSDVILIGNN